MREKGKTNVELQDYEAMPVPEEKQYGWKDQAMIWLGAGFALGSFATGGQIAVGLGFRQAMIAIFAGAIILTVLACLLGNVGASTHLSCTMSSRFTYGRVGAAVFAGIIAICNFGWFGYQCNFFGSSSTALLKISLGIDASETVLVVVGGLAMMITAIIGYKGIKMLSVVGVPLLFLLVVAAVIKTFTMVPLEDIVSSGPIGDPIPLTAGISLLVGSMAIGACMVPDISRYSKTKRDNELGCVIGFLIGYSLIVAFGAIFAYAFQMNDFSTVLISILGFSYVAAFILIVATWTTNDNNLYSSVLGVSTLFRELNVNVTRWKVTLVAGVLATAFGALGVINIFVPFLSLLCVLIPPFASVIVLDFCFHREDYDYARTDRIPTLRKGPLISAVIGCLVGLSMNTPPVGFGIPFMVQLSNTVPTALVAMAAALAAGAIFEAASKKH